MTHDNKSPLDKFGNRMLHLPLANLIASADQIVATTWGFDQMLLKNFCVVRETRLYPIQQDKLVVGEQKAEAAEQEHKFEIKWRDCKRMRVAGQFNDWKPTLELKRSGDIWSGTLKQSLVGLQQFKFVVDENNWVVNKELPTNDDGLGNINNFFFLKLDQIQKK